MAEKILRCPHCGAENPATAWFCQICNRDLGPTHVEVAGQAPVPVPSKEKKTIILVSVVAIVVVLIVAVTLAYYYQPVKGSLSPRSETIVKGQSVSFDFSPSGGIPPFTYNWNFGDGSSSPAKSPSHAYVSTGSYTVTVIVTDKAGVRGSWTTTITVRLALVFIDQMYYPSVYKNPLGDTRMELYVNGAQVVQGVGLTSNETFNIETKLIWVIDFGLGSQYIRYDTIADKTGTITSPATEIDLHYKFVWSEDAYGHTIFTLAPI